MNKLLNAGLSQALRLTGALILLPFCFSSAQAFEFDDGPIQGSIDTTLSYGTSARTESRDDDIICTANGGTAYGCNADDGNLNYDRGQISQVFKITTDIELNHKNRDIGAFFRFKGFVDSENNDSTDTERTPLDDRALDLVGSSMDLLDAYGWARFEMGDRPAEIRFGKHVLNWGESTFIQGGINAINPIDAAAIRLPGSELREALLPVSMISLSADVTDNLTLEGFYQLDWDKTIPDPSGSYFSVNDFATDGGNKVQLGFGDIPDTGFSFDGLGAGLTTAINTDIATFNAFILPGLAGGALVPFAPSTQSIFDSSFMGVTRINDNDPDDDGQWGIALRYFSEELNDTEFGFYFINYHSRLPLISAQTGDAATTTSAALAAGSLAVGNTTAALLGSGLSLTDAIATTNQIATLMAVDRYADSANYFIEYPEDIKLLGLSFNTNAGLWAIQGEYSHKKDAPLQIDDVEILFAALTPLGAATGSTTFNNNQVGVYGNDEYIRGYIERDVSQLQATATRIFSNVMGANEFVFVAEAAVTHVHDMPSKNTLRLNGPGTFTSGNPFHATAAGAHAGKAAEDEDHFPDATSWGFRVAGRWTYNDVYKSINLQPRVAYQHDVDGITPGPGGNFIEGRKALTLGMTATYKNQWSADLSVTSFFGAGRHNLLNDRDFVAFNLKYSF